MGTCIPDNKLFEYAHRVQGQTVIITGAAHGIGKETAITFGRHGANVVIGDIDEEGAAETVHEIKKVGGNAVSQACNVLDYDQLVSLFELSLSTFGKIDVVIANAGILRMDEKLTTDISTDDRGLPIKPSLKTVEMKLSKGLATQLASFYLSKNKDKGSLQALVLIASMASVGVMPDAPLYPSSKHGVLSLMGSIKDEFKLQGFRVASINPWFADTAIVSDDMRAGLERIPFVPVSRVVGTILLAATDEAPDANGSAYTLPDDREAFRIPSRHIEDIYKILPARLKRPKSYAEILNTVLESPFTKLLAISAIGYKGFQYAVLNGHWMK